MIQQALTEAPRFVIGIIATGVIVLVVAITTGMLLPLLVVGGGGILFILLFSYQPVALLYVVPLLLSVEYRVELGFFSFTIAEVSVALVWIVALLRIRNGQKFHLKKTDLTLLLLVTTASLPSVLFESDTRHALSVYRDFTIPLFFFTGFLMIDLSQRQIVKLLKFFVLMATVSAILGIMQYRTGNYIWTLRPEDVQWQNFKTSFLQSSMMGQLLGVKNTLAIGLFATTNNFASYLVIPTVLAFALASFPALRRREKVVWNASFIVLFVALLFTFSRGSLLTFLTAWLFLVWFRRKRRVSLLTVVVVASIGMLMIGLILWSGILSWDQLGTLKGRGVMFRAGIELIKDHPEVLLIGGFTEEYRAYYYQPQLIHNLPLYTILQFGLLATLSWLLLVVIELRYILRSIIHSKNQEVKFLGSALFGGIAATVFLYAQTTSFVDSVQSSLWLFFWIGMGIHLYRFSRGDALSYQRMVSVRVGVGSAGAVLSTQTPTSTAKET